MKKLLLFTALLSTSFASFCPAVALRHASPAGISQAAPATVASHTTPIAQHIMPSIIAQQTAATPLNTMIAQLLASITKPGSKTADIRLNDLTANVNTLDAGIRNIFVPDLDQTVKRDILNCIEIMQDETTKLLELFKETSFFNQYSNTNCQHLLKIQKVLGKLTEKINGVNLVWVAGKNTLSWMNNNRMRTVLILAMAPIAAKATSTAVYHAYQSGFNPFRFVGGAIKWAITPAFAKAAAIQSIAPVKETRSGWFN